MLTIDYFDSQLPLKSWIVSDSWESPHTCDLLVVFATIVYGERGKTYTIHVCGSDYYALDGSSLYCWIDPSQPWASKSRVGSIYNIDTGRSVDIDYVPMVRTKVRKGVMLDDTIARQLRLID